MVRTPSFDNKSGMKKGTWTPEEDKKLIAYVTRYGCWNWRQLPRFAGLARCGKSCRLRWLNYLRPDIKRGDYTQEEEEIIVKLHQKLGSRWSVIAANLSGRTDNDIKNYWNSCLKKRFQREKSQIKHDDGNLNKAIEPNIDSGSKNQDTDSEQSSVSFFKVTSPQNTTSKSFDTGPLSPQLSSSEFSTATADSSSNGNSVIEDLYFEDEDIWSESFLAELMMEDNTVTQIPDTQSLSPQSWNSECFVDAEKERFGSVEPEPTLMIKPTVEKSWIEQCVVPDMKLFAHQSDEYLCTVYQDDDDDDDDDVEFWNQSKHIGLGLF